MYESSIEDFNAFAPLPGAPVHTHHRPYFLAHRGIHSDLINRRRGDGQCTVCGEASVLPEQQKHTWVNCPRFDEPEPASLLNRDLAEREGVYHDALAGIARMHQAEMRLLFAVEILELRKQEGSHSIIASMERALGKMRVPRAGKENVVQNRVQETEMQARTAQDSSASAPAPERATSQPEPLHGIPFPGADQTKSSVNMQPPRTPLSEQVPRGEIPKRSNVPRPDNPATHHSFEVHGPSRSFQRGALPRISTPSAMPAPAPLAFQHQHPYHGLPSALRSHHHHHPAQVGTSRREHLRTFIPEMPTSMQYPSARPIPRSAGPPAHARFRPPGIPGPRSWSPPPRPVQNPIYRSRGPQFESRPQPSPNYDGHRESAPRPTLQQFFQWFAQTRLHQSRHISGPSDGLPKIYTTLTANNISVGMVGFLREGAWLEMGLDPVWGMMLTRGVDAFLDCHESRWAAPQYLR